MEALLHPQPITGAMILSYWFLGVQLKTGSKQVSQHSPVPVSSDVQAIRLSRATHRALVWA